MKTKLYLIILFLLNSFSVFSTDLDLETIRKIRRLQAAYDQSAYNLDQIRKQLELNTSQNELKRLKQSLDQAKKLKNRAYTSLIAADPILQAKDEASKIAQRIETEIKQAKYNYHNTNRKTTHTDLKNFLAPLCSQLDAAGAKFQAAHAAYEDALDERAFYAIRDSYAYAGDWDMVKALDTMYTNAQGFAYHKSRTGKPLPFIPTSEEI